MVPPTVKGSTMDYDGEYKVVDVDSDGCLICEKPDGERYNSGQTLAEYGVHNLTESEEESLPGAVLAERVRLFFEREGINCLTETTYCPDCGSENLDYDACEYTCRDCGKVFDGGECPHEAHFSWDSCDCCNAIAGDRYFCEGYHPESGEVLKGYEICPDCLIYVANGDLPAE